MREGEPEGNPADGRQERALVPQTNAPPSSPSLILMREGVRGWESQNRSISYGMITGEVSCFPSVIGAVQAARRADRY